MVNLILSMLPDRSCPRKDSMALVKSGKTDFIQDHHDREGRVVRGVRSSGERLGSSPNTARASGNLQPRSVEWGRGRGWNISTSKHQG